MIRARLADGPFTMLIYFDLSGTKLLNVIERLQMYTDNHPAPPKKTKR